MKTKIPSPISGGVILSYKCSAECRHCMYACSRKWSNDWISESDLVKLMQILSDKIVAGPYGIDTISLNHGLHFTGGEPFLNFELLLKAVEISENYDIPSTFVETNCSWCTDDYIVEDRLTLLKEKGLKGILISVNPFFLEYVPFERTKRAVKIAEEIFGDNLFVYQLDYYNRFLEMALHGIITFDEYLKFEKASDFAKNVEFFMTGRAPYRLKKNMEDVYHKYKAEIFYKTPCRPDFLRSWHNHFDNYGNFIPGYCGGLTLGSWNDMDDLINEGISLKNHPILGFLVHEDIKGLLNFAKDFGYIECREGYYSKCHVCVDVRKFLVDKGDFKELSPKEFYFHLC